MLVADHDSNRRPLRLNCTYRLEGPMPAANFWTLTLYRHDGELADAGLRASYTSSEALIGEDGSLRVMLSSDPQPGNWLPLRGSAPFELHLRLYETQVSTIGHALERVAMPAVAREACR